VSFFQYAISFAFHALAAATANKARLKHFIIARPAQP
jgi:hypothetical protein